MVGREIVLILIMVVIIVIIVIVKLDNKGRLKIIDTKSTPILINHNEFNNKAKTLTRVLINN